MKSILQIIGACLAVPFLVGCESENYLETLDPEPYQAGYGVITHPFSGQRFNTPASSEDKNASFKHHGDMHYSFCKNEILGQSGVVVSSQPCGISYATERNAQVQKALWIKPSFVNEYQVRLAQVGMYIFKTTYYTASKGLGVVNDLRREVNLSTTLPFKVCPPSGDPFCEGGSSLAAAFVPTVHTAAMGPFFAVAGVGSSVSEDEAEEIGESLTPAQIESVAPLIQQAYGEDVYEFFGITPPDDGGGDTDPPGECPPTVECVGGNAFKGAVEEPASAFESVSLSPRAGASAKRRSPFLSFTDPIVRADRARMTPQQRRYLNVVLRLRTKVENDQTSRARSRALSRAVGGASTVANPTVAPFHSLSNEGSLEAWPNPAVRSVQVRLIEGTSSAEVYDIRGRLVMRASTPSAGAWEWDLRGAAGQRVSPGLYSVVLLGEQGVLSRTSVIVR